MNDNNENKNGKERKSRSPFPPWLSKRVPNTPNRNVNNLLEDLGLCTVCGSARCPNQLECYSKNRATFLLMGPSCTRNCRYCAVDHSGPAPLDPQEPQRVAEAVKRLGLRHAVITSTTRDDLEDGGAMHFVQTVEEVRKANPGITVEILVPDFNGDPEAWAVAADCRPDVFNHNIETVPRLFPIVRPQADYKVSLKLLRFTKDRHPDLRTKSGLMVGLGETMDEVLEVARDLREAGVDMITVGQYLSPGGDRYPVDRFVTPEEFEELTKNLKQLHFAMVAAAPFVRSSYNAEEAFDEARDGGQ